MTMLVRKLLVREETMILVLYGEGDLPCLSSHMMKARRRNGSTPTVCMVDAAPSTSRRAQLTG